MLCSVDIKLLLIFVVAPKRDPILGIFCGISMSLSGIVGNGMVFVVVVAPVKALAVVVSHGGR